MEITHPGGGRKRTRASVFNSKSGVLPICFPAFLFQPPSKLSWDYQLPIMSRDHVLNSLVLTLEVKVMDRSHVTASPQLSSSLLKLVTKLWSQTLEGHGSDAGVSCGPGLANTHGLCSSPRLTPGATWLCPAGLGLFHSAAW